jgi:hypothetical protein
MVPDLGKTSIQTHKLSTKKAEDPTNNPCCYQAEGPTFGNTRCKVQQINREMNYKKKP